MKFLVLAIIFIIVASGVVLGEYTDNYSGTISNFTASGYLVPLFININSGEYRVRVIYNVTDAVTTIQQYDIDNGTYSYTNVWTFTMREDVDGVNNAFYESIYVLRDDFYNITISNGLTTVCIIVDNSSSGESFFGTPTNNYFDDIEIYVNGESVLSRTGNLAISIETIIWRNGDRELSVTIFEATSEGTDYTFFRIKLPGLWNVTVYRKGYSLENTGYQYPYWLPDIRVEVVDPLRVKTLYYEGHRECGGWVYPGVCAIWKTVWNKVYEHLGIEAYPIIYNGSDIVVGNTLAVLHSNVTVNSIESNQPIYVNDVPPAALQPYSPEINSENIYVHIYPEMIVDLGSKYMYKIKIQYSSMKPIVIMILSNSTLYIPGYGSFDRVAEIVISPTSYSEQSTSLILDPLPIVHASSGETIYVYTESSKLDIILHKIGENIVNDTITIMAENIALGISTSYNILYIGLILMLVLLPLSILKRIGDKL